MMLWDYDVLVRQSHPLRVGFEELASQRSSEEG